MTRMPFPVAMTALLCAALLSACSDRPPAAGSAGGASSEAAPAQAAEAEAFPFRIGSLEAFALKDGDIVVPNDGGTFGVGRTPDEVAALLAAAGLPTDALHLSIQPLLVRGDGRVLLFDTGAGDAAFARAGRLQDALRAAGVGPEQVTDVFLSHAHPDHVGGLLTREGALAFPNAAIHLSAPEWSALQGQADSAALVAAIAPKVAAFPPGSAVLPGLVAAVAVDGHTPGHSAYEIASGDARLLYLGDAAHHSVVSVQRPDWTVQFDADAPLAQASRRALLQRADAEQLRLYAVHFPYPGLGRVEARGDSWVWVPER